MIHMVHAIDLFTPGYDSAMQEELICFPDIKGVPELMMHDHRSLTVLISVAARY